MSALAIAGGTKIEWADFTFNPWWGCERVSPGCAHCYAETLSKRRQPGVQLWGDGHDFRFFGDAHWAEPLKWARLAPAKLGRRPRVFCASMADVFEERPELEEHRERLFGLIVDTPELDWLVLTKRPEFARDWMRRAVYDCDCMYGSCSACATIENLWLGVSIENSRYTWRADVLREIPAAVRFISAEPLLGSLYDRRDDDDSVRVPILQGGRRADGDGLARSGDDRGTVASPPLPASSDPLASESEVPLSDAPPRRRAPLDLTGIDWVIVGGESGPGARPFHLEHAREIIDRCVHLCESCARAYYEDGLTPQAPACTGRPAIFVKQLGAKPVERIEGVGVHSIDLRDSKGGDPSEWPEDLRIREFPRSAA